MRSSARPWVLPCASVFRRRRAAAAQAVGAGGSSAPAGCRPRSASPRRVDRAHVLASRARRSAAPDEAIRTPRGERAITPTFEPRPCRPERACAMRASGTVPASFGSLSSTRRRSTRVAIRFFAISAGQKPMISVAFGRPPAKPVTPGGPLVTSGTSSMPKRSTFGAVGALDARAAARPRAGRRPRRPAMPAWHTFAPTNSTRRLLVGELDSRRARGASRRCRRTAAPSPARPGPRRSAGRPPSTRRGS